MAAIPEDLGSVNYPWRFPAAPDAGGMHLLNATLSVPDDATRSVPEHNVADAGGPHSAPSSPGLPECAEYSLEPHSAASQANGTPPSKASFERRLQFRTHIPQRFGPFGWVENQITLLGGWYPLPVAAGAPCAPENALIAGKVLLRVTVEQSGLLVVGNQSRLVGPGSPWEVEVELSQPLLLAFTPAFALVVRHAPGGRLTGVTGQGKGSAAYEALEETLSLLASLTARSPTLLVVQAPLREVLAIPFSGGLLVSDRLFRTSGLGPVKARQAAAVAWAAAAESEMSRGSSYADGLVAGALALWLNPPQSEKATSLRTWFRRGEVFAVVDQIGTDPQTGFQQALFSMAWLPGELAQVPFYGLVHPESPWVEARQLAMTLGRNELNSLMARAHAKGESPLAAIRQHLAANGVELGRALRHERKVDLQLTEVRDGGITVDAQGDPGPWFVELRTSNRSVPTGGGYCASFPCALSVPMLEAHDQVLLDGDERLAQWSAAAEDPRRNDRNYLDLKWMLSKLAFSASTHDSVPFAQAELVLQPRHDLGHMAYVTPFAGPVRSGLLAGFRRGLGQRNRVNSLSTYVSLGPRFSVDSQEMESWTLGVLATFLYTTYQSRTNPFDGDFLYGYLLPMYAASEQGVGLRGGFIATRLFGSTPDHILAVRISGDTAWGSIPQFEEAYSGGAEGIRALKTQGTSRRHKLASSLEYRWMVVRNLWSSLAGLAWLEGIQTALFVDGALLADAPDELFRSDAPFLGAGIGLRPHVQVLGFVPAMVSLDFAYLFPIGGSDVGGWSVVLGFAQPL